MERGTVSMRVALCYDLLRFSLCSGICAMTFRMRRQTAPLTASVVANPPPQNITKYNTHISTYHIPVQATWYLYNALIYLRYVPGSKVHVVKQNHYKV
jgi:hypothetical protein